MAMHLPSCGPFVCVRVCACVCVCYTYVYVTPHKVDDVCYHGIVCVCVCVCHTHVYVTPHQIDDVCYHGVVLVKVSSVSVQGAIRVECDELQGICAGVNLCTRTHTHMQLCCLDKRPTVHGT